MAIIRTMDNKVDDFMDFTFFGFMNGDADRTIRTAD
jgi:hypothetical protein